MKQRDTLAMNVTRNNGNEGNFNSRTPAEFERKYFCSQLLCLCHCFFNLKKNTFILLYFCERHKLDIWSQNHLTKFNRITYKKFLSKYTPGNNSRISIKDYKNLNKERDKEKWVATENSLTNIALNLNCRI